MEDFKNLNYDNEFGSFSSDGSEYWIRQSKKKRIPVEWSNILTNEKFGSVITDTMGGYTWYINSQTNRMFHQCAVCHIHLSSKVSTILCNPLLFATDNPIVHQSLSNMEDRQLSNPFRELRLTSTHSDSPRCRLCGCRV